MSIVVLLYNIQFKNFWMPSRKSYQFTPLSEILTHHQHGFMPGKSTITNLFWIYTYEVMINTKSNIQVDAINLDVFESFWYCWCWTILCYKLELMVLNTQLLDWLRDYFIERQQIVKLNRSFMSQPINVSSGVGQGYPSGAELSFKLMLAVTPHYFQKHQFIYSLMMASCYYWYIQPLEPNNICVHNAYTNIQFEFLSIINNIPKSKLNQVTCNEFFMWPIILAFGNMWCGMNYN